MELIPAIDLLDGKVVRLHQGRYDEVTVYSDDPASVAKLFEASGAKRLHVVDLDGAKSGEACNVAAIEAILGATRLKVQVGGGVRNEAAAERWMNAGATRVVLGTIAIKDAPLAEQMCKRWPGGVVVAIDARDGFVAVEGWLEQSERLAVDLAKDVDAWGAGAILFTNIKRDGTRLGPDVEETAKLQSLVSTDVIASGGIGELGHLRSLAEAGVRYSVCGRALFSGAFKYEEAAALLREAGC